MDHNASVQMHKVVPVCKRPTSFYASTCVYQSKVAHSYWCLWVSVCCILSCLMGEMLTLALQKPQICTLRENARGFSHAVVYIKSLKHRNVFWTWICGTAWVNRSLNYFLICNGLCLCSGIIKMAVQSVCMCVLHAFLRCTLCCNNGAPVWPWNVILGSVRRVGPRVSLQCCPWRGLSEVMGCVCHVMM